MAGGGPFQFDLGDVAFEDFGVLPEQSGKVDGAM